MKARIFGWAVILAGFACVLGAAEKNSDVQQRADRFLELVNAAYQQLYRVQSEAQWLAATDVSPAHDAGSETAGKASAAFNGNPAIIREAQALLKEKKNLKEGTWRGIGARVVECGGRADDKSGFGCGPHPSGDATGFNVEWVCVQTGWQADHGERNR